MTYHPVGAVSLRLCTTFWIYDITGKFGLYLPIGGQKEAKYWWCPTFKVTFTPRKRPPAGRYSRATLSRDTQCDGFDDRLVHQRTLNLPDVSHKESSKWINLIAHGHRLERNNFATIIELLLQLHSISLLFKRCNICHCVEFEHRCEEICKGSSAERIPRKKLQRKVANKWFAGMKMSMCQMGSAEAWVLFPTVTCVGEMRQKRMYLPPTIVNYK